MALLILTIMVPSKCHVDTNDRIMDVKIMKNIYRIYSIRRTVNGIRQKKDTLGTLVRSRRSKQVSSYDKRT